MVRAYRRREGGGPATLAVRLGFEDRHRRRFAVTATTGERILIDLSAATQLRHGDVLDLDDGRTMRIDAADEDVADIAAPDAPTLVRLAWHLGNRHTPTAVMDGRLRIRRDHVLEAMAERLGGTVATLAAPFDPEPGAYAEDAGHTHWHDRHDGHEHVGQHDDAPERGRSEGSSLAAGHPRQEGHHRHHRVVACGDGADGDVADPAPAHASSDADERAG